MRNIIQNRVVFFTIIILLLSMMSCVKNNKTTYNIDTFTLLPMPQELEIVAGNLTISVLENEPEIIIDPLIITNPQGYQLIFNNKRPIITASDEAGVYYAKKTIKQINRLLTEGKTLPAVKISDWPDFLDRGVMLDISRDRILTMESLYKLVDQLADWKINQFQLYTEHTFAYKNHKKVWKEASPMTADQIKELDAYCRERFIDLVPNQNSFGHMERWLKHDEYKHLAELEVPTDVGDWGLRSRHILSPAVPETLEFIDELYEELLPNFTSKMFNIGCDETLELGFGKSKDLTEQFGKGKVYLNYLVELRNRAEKQDKRVQFWGDIILNHPELISELPKDMIPLIWGYEANHPFDKQCKKFKEAGLEFYVCPGTSSWGSVTGRIDNMKGNNLNAAINGKKYGAKGFLITDWGDYGTWQPFVFSQPGFLYGAALAWAVDKNESIPLDDYLSYYVFDDKSRKSGRAVYEIGNSPNYSGVKIANEGVLFIALKKVESPLSEHWKLKEIKLENMYSSLELLDRALDSLKNSSMQGVDRELTIEEVAHGVSILKHSCNMIIAKLESGDKGLEYIDENVLQNLRNDMKIIIENHNKLWIKRNRIGGLADSSEKFEKILLAYDEAIEKHQ